MVIEQTPNSQFVLCFELTFQSVVIFKLIKELRIVFADSEINIQNVVLSNFSFILQFISKKFKVEKAFN